MIRRPPRSTLFPYRRSSDLPGRDGDPLSRPERLPPTTPHRRGGPRSDRGGRGIRRSRASVGGRCGQDRKSTRLNSSHSSISYAVFCLKKKKNKNTII